MNLITDTMWTVG